MFFFVAKDTRMKWSHPLLVPALAALTFSFNSSAQVGTPAAPEALELSGQYRGTHDPSIMEENGTYYVFATGAAAPAERSAQTSSPDAPSGTASSAALPQLPIRCSPDLHAWRRCGAVFPDGIPQWIRDASPKTRELWAPDISFYDGTYHLYYAYSTFGSNSSGIALATNRTLDSSSPNYKWIDQGLVLNSKPGDNFNAIDPNLVLDEHGDAWLSFGSFWTGIKMRKLDRATGKLSATDTKTYSLAARKKPENAAPARPGLPADWEAIEAPFVFRHGDYYYLFTSWDLCCRGVHSTYHTVVGRSRSVHGPYVDKYGKKLAKGGGTPFLVANARWDGPGGESLLHLKDNDIIVFHAYDAKTGFPALQISTLSWKDGWPIAALGEGGQ
jgi:arabinan endo-1,5-alpha-L-arabinosidase